MTHKVLTCSLKHTRAEKGWLLKFGVASFFFLGFLFLLWSCSSKKNPVEAEKVGSIFVDSNVPGASIELDDKPTGEQTPHTFENIKVGKHKVLVRKAEYISTPELDTVEVFEGRLTTVNFFLANKVGKIWVNSDPQEAQIILDHVNTQKVTPDTIESVGVGEHTVSVEKQGFLPSPESLVVTVDEDQTSLVEFNLISDTLHGSLLVASEPSGATIVVDNQTTDKTTPHLFFSEVPIGTHLVSVFKEEHSNDDPAKQIVNLTGGDTVDISFKLILAASVGPDSAGQLAPDFKLYDDYGELIKLYNYRGFVVIVNFWANGCANCLMELDFLQEQYEKYSEDSLKIFAVNYGDGLGTIKFHRNDKSLTYHLLVGKESQMLKDYDILGEGTPVTIIIDRSGLTYSWVRGYGGPGSSEAREMRTALFELFGH